MTQAGLSLTYDYEHADTHTHTPISLVLFLKLLSREAATKYAVGGVSHMRYTVILVAGCRFSPPTPLLTSLRALG